MMKAHFDPMYGGGGGGVVQNRESPDFRSPEVGRYASIKLGMLCLRASQVWSDLWSQITIGLDISILIMFVQRFIRSESSKYNWRSSSGD